MNHAGNGATHTAALEGLRSRAFCGDECGSSCDGVLSRHSDAGRKASVLHGLRFVDDQSSSQEVSAIASVYTLRRNMLAHFDKSKTTRMSGKSVHTQVDRFCCESIALKPSKQIVRIGLVRQIAYEDLLGHVERGLPTSGCGFRRKIYPPVTVSF